MTFRSFIVAVTLICTSSCFVCLSQQKSILNKRPNEVSITSFNMRCDVPEDDKSNNWANRIPRIAKYITEQGLDVVATQELVGTQDSTLLAALPDYTEIKAIDGVNAILYSPSQVKILRSGYFSLSECPDSLGKKGWDAAFPRFALWAVMQHRTSGKQFVLLNTHLDHIGAVNRREGAKLIISQLKNIAGNMPVVVTGDFNADEHSEAYSILTNDHLVDAYKVAKSKYGVPYTWHNYGRLPMSERSKIDFVLVSKSVKVTSCTIPQEQPGAMLSDHSPLTAILQF